MSTSALAIVIAAALLAMLVATWRLRNRIHVGEDFSLARRRLPAMLCGMSQAINCVPLWFLLALSAYAYAVGLAAMWLALATLLGMLFNWWFIAPRLRALALGMHTLSQWFAASAGDRLTGGTLRSAAIIVVIALGLTTVTSVQWAAESIAITMDGGFATAVVFIVIALFLIVILGGMWSASVADVLQAAVVLGVFLVAAIASIVAVGGFASLQSGITRHAASGFWFGGYTGVLALALLVGVSFAAFGSAAQPQATARYFACKDDATMQRARLLALAWVALVLSAALLLGWCAKILEVEALTSRGLLSGLLARVTPAPVAGLFDACILIAFVAACASPWVAIATHAATDLRATGQGLSILWCRWAVVVIAIAVAAGALYLPVGSEDRLWFCWQSLSAAFGPLLLVRLSGKKVRPGSSLGAMWSGFVLTILFHLMPDTPGDLLERSLPFIAAMGIALSGGERRRNPDRADRSDRTVHDHLPI